ncbi:hypothetical protein LEP1GSC050_1603 [Leptospira broomii serovar Hurstbridge str. 5399]|uniref:Uncharacterized protein n=1 Tax=Leptospira broomii serovar Hurstbridge str. 5399 TaxID=1049789 RepID=T0G9H4_9LEPT|nr:hypothetical protein LEP1GSC050_1603 [Leptospira broomii serovar Hurstbridge str. 5399]
MVENCLADFRFKNRLFYIVSRSFVFRSALILLFSVFFTDCYKKPVQGSVMDFLTFSSASAVSTTPVPVNVQVTGLGGNALVVSNSLNESLTFNSDGTLTFPTAVAAINSYNVQIVSGPPVASNLSCRINNPNGPITYPSTLIVIQCAQAFNNLNVTVVGIASGNTSTLLIQNSTDTLSFTGNGTQIFANQVGAGNAYNVQILSAPTGHNCAVTTIPNPGTMPNSAFTININCLSAIAFSPNSMLVPQSSSAFIKFSSHGINSCVINGAATIAGRTNIGSGNVTITTLAAPNDDMIQLTPGPAAYWGISAGQVFVNLTGCKDGAGNSVVNPTGVWYNFNVTSNVMYVSFTGGNDLNNCNSISTECRTIQRGVNACNATGTVCYVLVQGGSTYPITVTATDQIVLNAKTSVLGSYDATFTVQDVKNNPSIISDNQACAGAYPGSICTPVLITTAALTLASDFVQFSGFVVKALPNADASAAILIGGTAGPGQIRIGGNVLDGGQASANAALGGKVGIYITSSANVLVGFNYIYGGSGRNISAGVVIDSSSVVLAYNRINGMQSAPTGYSSGVIVQNFTAANVSAITNNEINGIQYLNQAAILPVISYGIQATSSADPTNLYIFNNSIYLGNATSGALGNATGIIAQSLAGLPYSIYNNQIFGQSGSLPSNGVGLAIGNLPGAGSIVRGNNFYTNIPAIIGGAQYSVCSTFTLSSTICSAPTLPPTGNFTNSYNANPNFIATASEDFVFFPKSPGALGTPSSSTMPCTSMYGGVTPTIPAAYLPLFNTDLALTTRTTTPYILQPLGSNAVSVGAFELNSNCL